MIVVLYYKLFVFWLRSRRWYTAKFYLFKVTFLTDFLQILQEFFFEFHRLSTFSKKIPNIFESFQMESFIKIILVFLWKKQNVKVRKVWTLDRLSRFYVYLRLIESFLMVSAEGYFKNCTMKNLNIFNK